MGIAHPPAVEILLHCIAGTQQRDLLQVGFLDRPGGGVSDVQKRHVAAILDLVGDLMHGIGTEYDPFSPGTFEASGGAGENIPGPIPVAARLAGLNVMKIDAVQQQAGGVQAAQPGFYSLVDQTVVGNSRFPAHAAQ